MNTAHSSCKVSSPRSCIDRLLVRSLHSKAEAKPGEDAAFTNTPLAAAFEAFLFNANEIGTAVEDFAASFDINDKKALAANLAKLKLLHASGYKEGYESTVVALKANEAVNQKTKITFDPAWFELA